MKVWIVTDERYPDHDVCTEYPGFGAPEIEVDEETYERWTRVTAEYNSVQREIGKAIGDD